MEQEYYAVIREEEANCLNPRGFRKKMRGGKVKHFVGTGLKEQSEKEDIADFEAELALLGITKARITTKP